MAVVAFLPSAVFRKMDEDNKTTSQLSSRPFKMSKMLQVLHKGQKPWHPYIDFRNNNFKIKYHEKFQLLVDYNTELASLDKFRDRVSGHN
jgi:hypothetical protein